jgi:tRNA (cytidine/uridine-2'-O-)-methyltransferase
VFHIALYQPEIPPNTGNIIRLCANTGAFLHLIHPLGFAWDDKHLKRAGLDYWEWAEVRQHASHNDFESALAGKRVFAFSTHAKTNYAAVSYRADDVFLFGPESRGLPKELLEGCEPGHALRLPMVATSRSLNLSNAVAVVLYEAWRQLDFLRNDSRV